MRNYSRNLDGIVKKINRSAWIQKPRKTKNAETRELSLVSTLFTQRRRRDLNSRAAINDLLPFQGSPFSHLGTSPNTESFRIFSCIRKPDGFHGEGGIRTHAPLRTNGFQDRLVMTTSIPLQTESVLTHLIRPNLLLLNSVAYVFHTQR